MTRPRARRIGAHLLLPSLAAALVGCGEPPGDPDAEADGGSDGGCPELAPFATGGEGSTELAVPPAAGRAVAGRITSETQLLSGLKPRGRVGDFLLANDRVAVVVEDARRSDGYGPAGGEVLDVDLVGPSGPRGESLFGEMLIGVLPQILAAESVTVLEDGSSGGAAAVRVVGRLGPMWLLDDCCSAFLPRGIGLPAALDYVLEPGSAAVELRLTVRNDTEVVERPESILTVLLSGDGARRYAPAVGFDEGADFGMQPYVALVGDRIGYAWIPGRGAVRYLLTYSGFHVYDSEAVDLPACEDTSFGVGHLVVSGGDPSAAAAAVREARGEEPLPAITGRVTEADGSPAALVRVHVTDERGRHVTMGRTGEDGTFRVEAEPGGYLLQPWLDGRRPPEPAAVTLGAAGAEADLELGPVGRLAFTARDGDGVEIPAKISVVPLDGPAPTAPSSFGEARHPAGAMAHLFALPGRGEVVLATGRYRVVGSRGYEHEIDEVDVTVEAGGTAEVELALPRTVETTGWLAGDFHVHTMYSPDSNDLLEWKVAASAAVGLEIPVCTDHRWVGDLEPAVARLGLERWVRWFPGQEVTTFVFGHFNAYPLQVRPDEPNNGAFDVAGRSPLELFADVWADPLEPVLQVNHPRGSAIGAYFSWVGLEPDTLEVAQPDGWSPDFDAIEVWNREDWLETRESTVRDWFGMLRAGHLVTATGNSDSHNAEWSDVGYPRNYLALGTDDPRAIEPDDLRDAVRRGRVVVSGGLFVTVEAEDGSGPGEVAAATAGRVTVRVRVQAPSWMDADQLEVFVDGVAIESVRLDESTEDPENPVVRFDRELEIPLDEDAWIVVAAWSEGTLAPASHGVRPFGATNALYVDADGDGEYRASGRLTR